MCAPALAQDELPWVCFVRVVDNAHVGLDAKISALVQQSLLRGEVNVVPSEELAAAAAARRVPRTAWAEPGALKETAAAVGVDYLVFARTSSSSRSAYEIELYAVHAKTDKQVASEVLQVAGDVARAKATGGPSWSTVDALVQRLLVGVAKAAKEASEASAASALAASGVGGASAGGAGGPGDASASGGAGASGATGATGATGAGTGAGPGAGAGASQPGQGDVGRIAAWAGVGLASAGAIAGVVVGAIAGAAAWTTSEALVTQRNGSEAREAKEQESINQAIVADVGYGSALVLAGVATGLVFVAVAE